MIILLLYMFNVRIYTTKNEQTAKHDLLKKSAVTNSCNLMLIKIQPDAPVCRYLFTAKSLYMFRVSQHPSSGVLKTVTAISGTGHNTGTATSLQRGPLFIFFYKAKLIQEHGHRTRSIPSIQFNSTATTPLNSNKTGCRKTRPAERQENVYTMSVRQ